MESKKTDTKKKKEIPEVVNKLHEKHLEKIRKENTKARNKRKRKLSDSSLDEIIKKLADEVICEHFSKIKKVADEGVCENIPIVKNVKDEVVCENSSVVSNVEDEEICKNISTIKDIVDEEELVCENTSITGSVEGNVENKAACKNISKTQHDIDRRRERDYLEWKQKHYDTYNSVNVENVIKSINILEKAMSKKKGNPQKRYCTSSNSVKSTEVVWATSTYFIRYIKSCVLRHDWKPIVYLLQYMLSHKQLYYGYIKEVTFFTSLMLSKENPNIMKSLKQCFRRRDMSYANKFDIWYVNED